MIDTQLPCAVFVSDFTDPEALILEILKNQKHSKANYVEGNIKAIPWKIDTKYYQATVHLCPVKCDTVLKDEYLSLVEAIVLYFDNKSVESFECVKKWFDNIKDISPEIQLLICDTFEDSPPGSVPQSLAQKWCLDNGFELIELNSNETDNENADYNIIPDKKGTERIIEALHTHMWPNMDMKTSSSHSKQTNNEKDEENALGDSYNDDFCDLFSQLNSMKESLSSLPLRDRHVCAEQVVSSFWKAIGGDDDEIDDISK